jgi:RNA polymerase sigma factor (sigma-70 family)
MWTALTAEEQTSLARQIRDGDAAAEEAFARLFGERIRVMMLARVHDAEVARELSQDVMLASWRAIREARVRAPERLAAFVHGIARNVVNNYVRRRADEPELRSLTGDVERLPDPGAEPDWEGRALVSAALARLSTDDRQVLVLTLVQGLAPREIAARLGLSVDVVRARKSRATRRIIEVVTELSRNPGRPPTRTTIDGLQARRRRTTASTSPARSTVW